MTWNDFNDAQDQMNFDVIPHGTLAKVKMTIKPGGYDDSQNDWTGGYATHNPATGSVYLSCEFVVLEGPYVRRKIWSLIGLHSSKGPQWQNMGRSFIKGILSSARGINPKDTSAEAQSRRCVTSMKELDGVDFIARIDVEQDSNGTDRNIIKQAITPDHNDYTGLMNSTGSMSDDPFVF